MSSFTAHIGKSFVEKPCIPNRVNSPKSGLQSLNKQKGFKNFIKLLATRPILCREAPIEVPFSEKIVVTISDMKLASECTFVPFS